MRVKGVEHAREGTDGVGAHESITFVSGRHAMLFGRLVGVSSWYNPDSDTCWVAVALVQASKAVAKGHRVVLESRVCPGYLQ